jgi:DNA-binding response OmpR family regulator
VPLAPLCKPSATSRSNQVKAKGCLPNMSWKEVRGPEGESAQWRLLKLLTCHRASRRKYPLSYYTAIRFVDLRGTRILRDGTPVALSAREFRLLRYLIDHKGATVSREDILRDVWGYDAGTSSRTVDVHVANLRQKLETDPKRPQLIITHSGIGYKFDG